MKILHNKMFWFFMVCLLSLHTIAMATSAIYPLIERDSNGNAVVVWLEYVEGTLSIRANTYTEGVWGSPQTIMSGGIITSNPVLGICPVSGTDISAVVVWADDSGESTYTLFSSMLTSSASTWTTPNEIPLGTNENVNDDYALRVHPDGSAVLVYTVYDSVTEEQPVKLTTTTINSSNTWATPIIISGS